MALRGSENEHEDQDEGARRLGRRLGGTRMKIKTKVKAGPTPYDIATGHSSG
jgi:hypothetical protein